MNEKKPLVTIVMPCLDEEAYVGKALRSLLDDWAVRNCEVLVADGGSAGGIPFRIINPAELVDNVLPEAFGKMRASKSP
jgi:glycosyltransferase involved in cell wall biosynthesis